ncbi:MAG: hypothetical protein R2932_16730 [Caldilineaceae bacterium]
MRNEEELARIRDDINTNPARWLEDQLYPDAPSNRFNLPYACALTKPIQHLLYSILAFGVTFQKSAQDRGLAKGHRYQSAMYN